MARQERLEGPTLRFLVWWWENVRFREVALARTTPDMGAKLPPIRKWHSGDEVRGVGPGSASPATALIPKSLFRLPCDSESAFHCLGS
jgi:hypothetical protein